MRIGELASATGVSTRALRYYEEQGLLHPERSPAGHRRFERGDVEVVARIRDLLSAGFCSTVIRGLLPGALCPHEHHDDLHRALRDARARLESEREAIDSELAAIAELGRRWELDLDVHVMGDGDSHDTAHASTAAPLDHRDRRLR